MLAPSFWFSRIGPPIFFVLALVMSLVAAEPVATAVPWEQIVNIDPVHPHHFTREDGSRFFLFNKTAWHYFSVADPVVTLYRATHRVAKTHREWKSLIYRMVGPI